MRRAVDGGRQRRGARDATGSKRAASISERRHEAGRSHGRSDIEDDLLNAARSDPRRGPPKRVTDPEHRVPRDVPREHPSLGPSSGPPMHAHRHTTSQITSSNTTHAACERGRGARACASHRQSVPPHWRTLAVATRPSWRTVRRSAQAASQRATHHVRTFARAPDRRERGSLHVASTLPACAGTSSNCAEPSHRPRRPRFATLPFSSYARSAATGRHRPRTPRPSMLRSTR